jgi:hypothetical protein
LTLQIQTLKNELEVEIRKRQQYISHGISAVADVAGATLLAKIKDNRYAPTSASAFDLVQLVQDSAALESKKLDDDYRTAAKHRLDKPQPVRGRSAVRRTSPLRAAVTAAGLFTRSPTVTRAASAHRVQIPVFPPRMK